MSVPSVTNKPGIRLNTSIVVTIPSHNITMIPLELPFRALQCNGINTELFEVIKQPYLFIFCMLLKFDTRYSEQLDAIVVYVSDEDVILNKSMTLCFVQKTDLTTKTPHP